MRYQVLKIISSRLVRDFSCLHPDSLYHTTHESPRSWSVSWVEGLPRMRSTFFYEEKVEKRLGICTLLLRKMQEKQKIILIWYKRDLRISDHRPLADALARWKSQHIPVIAFYSFEPRVTTAPDFSDFHRQFIEDSLHDLSHHSRIYESSFLSSSGIYLMWWSISSNTMISSIFSLMKRREMLSPMIAISWWGSI